MIEGSCCCGAVRFQVGIRAIHDGYVSLFPMPQGRGQYHCFHQESRFETGVKGKDHVAPVSTRTPLTNMAGVSAKFAAVP